LHDGIPKICDFGIAKTKGTITTSLHTQTGTYNWMAPGLYELLACCLAVLT
jgi:serine/threonine protein kinase